MIPSGIKDICELFDCQVRTDISDPPRFHTDNARPVPVYALGQPTEMDAGLWGYTLTPWFYSMKSLERYCHSKKGREAINREAGQTFPQWNTEKQEWTP